MAPVISLDLAVPSLGIYSAWVSAVGGLSVRLSNLSAGALIRHPQHLMCVLN